MRHTLVAMGFAATLAVGCAPRERAAELPATFVGRAACARCHAAEDRAWQGSHHQLAMQPATDSTVLGDFRDARFRYGAVVTRFFRRDRHFMVRTDGPDGRMADFEVAYAFGVSPLQQYLIAFPGGRFQALGIAWDARPRARGGQRWFHLYPTGHVTPRDPLHWTRIAQNWNLQCAACHSTNLHKNYDPSTRTYHTTWSELDVACEACHGPGSRHVAWADSARVHPGTAGPTSAAGMRLVIALDERQGISWNRDPATDLPRRSTPRTSAREIEMCARCHSSRTRLFDDDPPGSPLLETHLPALLTRGLYRADGQVEGEVYEYGSFLQSRMGHEGVTCSDCHEPHGLGLRAPGNALCLTCHDGSRYDTVTHHHHAMGTPATDCVTCHMPSHTFMVVHERHDHSLRVPRPDLSDSLDTPNGCASCHGDRPARWAAERIGEWIGRPPDGFQRFAPALHASRAGAQGAVDSLAALARDRQQPPIARATAVAALGEDPDAMPVADVRRALADSDPLLRLGGVEAASELPSESRWDLLAPLLDDSIRTLRALAGGALAGTPEARVPAERRAAFQRARNEYRAGELENADQPFALVNLGNLDLAEGDVPRAERAFREALELDADWIPAYANLADLLRAANREDEAESVLRAGLARQPTAAALHHALGLLLVRRGRRDEALRSLARAVALAPDDGRFAFVYAVGLEDAGRPREALKVVESALSRRPGDRQLSELWVQLQSPSARP